MLVLKLEFPCMKKLTAMGSAVYGQLGSPVADGKIPTFVEAVGNL